MAVKRHQVSARKNSNLTPHATPAVSQQQAGVSATSAGAASSCCAPHLAQQEQAQEGHVVFARGQRGVHQIRQGAAVTLFSGEGGGGARPQQAVRVCVREV
jgi:hypothetical protein